MYCNICKQNKPKKEFKEKLGKKTILYQVCVKCINSTQISTKECNELITKIAVKLFN